MTPHSEKRVNATHIVPHIPRGKGSQKIKFGHLTEYNLRNIFLEKSFTKCGIKTIAVKNVVRIKIENISGLIV